uniref:1-acylglycerol-3-phosphate O-acyltransferase n=3 Tax=Anthurium amnicola TaxID=1678845 RepID=A0A1D1ZDH5_9ARAE
MEIQEPLNSSNWPRHRPLTPFHMLRGALLLLINLSSAFMVLVFLAPVTTVLVRLFSIHHSRIATSFLFGMWLSLWPFMFEKINKTKVVFSGETVPEKERALILANHRTEVDWMFLWGLAARKDHLGYIRYVLKSSLMKLPVFGWAFHILEFIPVERKWEIDEPNMRHILSTYKDPDDPLWLAVFPEGTDFTEQKCIRSQQFAAENGLPILRNVLLPKTRGFYTCYETLRCSIDAVYDVTIAYKHRCPLFRDIVFGVDPSEVHIHVKRIPVHEIPISENDTATWLIERFRIKDHLLSDFTIQGHFPNQGTEGDLLTLKYLAISAVIIVVTLMCTYLSIFSSVWFKIYIIASCSYLASATYFNIRPPPILASIKALCFGVKSV